MEVIDNVVVDKKLRWAGHFAHMDDCRLPKRLLFGWLPQRRPTHGTEQHWRDKVRKYLKQFGIEESSWSHKAQDRLYWRAVCKEGLTAGTEERQRKRSTQCRGPRAAADAPTPAASLVPGHSGGGKTLQDTSARQLGHAFLVRFQQMLFDLSLPLHGRKASPVPGVFLSRF